jgi:hypothetical protein
LSKVELRSSLRRCTLTIISIGAIVYWTSACALAQEVAVAGSKVNTYSTSSSFELPGSDPAPRLEIVMADREDPLLHGSHQRNLRAQPAFGGQPIERSQGQEGAKPYSLLGDRSMVGSFRYEYLKNDLLLRQRSPDRESPTHEAQSATRPLFQVELGGWRVPVLLSTAASQ